MQRRILEWCSLCLRFLFYINFKEVDNMNAVYVVPTASPNDVSGLKDLIDRKVIDPRDVIAILGKTEGNGCVNDWTRGYSVDTLKNFFSQYLDGGEAEKIVYVMSGGTEGILSPHLSIICHNDEKVENEGLEKSLAISAGRTREFLPEEIGRMPQVEAVRDTVIELMAKAGIEDSKDVHFVQVKCPLIISQRVADAMSRGKTVATEDTYESMGYSRGACALGIALALGEIPAGSVTDDKICKDWSLYSKVASTSAGVELMECEIILFGNSKNGNSRYFMSHDVMKDAIDAEAVMCALDKADIGYLRTEHSDKKELVQVLAKAEADPLSIVRGRRNIMHDDSDINHTRHARAVVGGVIASIVGDPMVYVSGGSEH
ncbi:MAG: ring-opening amidohydrolase, partial [Lachnospiraceae bacterium]|nr:ring-opening amidohydrolase [Lachnospiraceae bacterium]